MYKIVIFDVQNRDFVHHITLKNVFFRIFVAEIVENTYLICI